MLGRSQRCLRRSISQLHGSLFDYHAPRTSSQTGSIGDDLNVGDTDADEEHNVNSGKGKKRPSANNQINACSNVLTTSKSKPSMAELHRNIQESGMNSLQFGPTSRQKFRSNLRKETGRKNWQPNSFDNQQLHAIRIFLLAPKIKRSSTYPLLELSRLKESSRFILLGPFPSLYHHYLVHSPTGALINICVCLFAHSQQLNFTCLCTELVKALIHLQFASVTQSATQHMSTSR